MGFSSKTKLTFLAIILTMGLNPPSLWSASNDANQGWENLRTFIQIPENEEDEKPKANLQQIAADANVLTILESIDCDPSPGASNHNCLLKNLNIQTVSSSFHNIIEAHSFIMIESNDVKIRFECNENLCPMAYPAISQCANMAMQVKLSGKKMNISFSMDAGYKAENISNRIKNGQQVTLSLGDPPLQTLACWLPK